MSDLGSDLRRVSAHQTEHQAFPDEVTCGRSAPDSLQGDGAMAPHDFMVDWLIHHILGDDQRMAHQITAIAAGASPKTAFDADPLAQDPSLATLLGRALPDQRRRCLAGG